MAYFCSRCGKFLAEGEICSCAKPVSAPTPASAPAPAPAFNANSVKGFIESMKNRMGIGDPELNKGDAFEKNKLIIPDCVRANEGEIPVKQYKVATLRNRILGIPYTKAVGRIQVTNKRVIFRAPGRSLAGRTTLQHEFSIDELAGVEARREYVFSPWDLIIGFIVAIIGGSIFTYLIQALCSSGLSDGKTGGVIFLTLLLGIAGCIPFFMLKKKWLLKLLCLGGSTMSMLFFGSIIPKIGSSYSYYYYESNSSGGAEFFGGFLTFLGIIALIFMLFTLFVFAIKPNLVLLIKTKSTSDAIDIKRKKMSLLGGLFGGKEEEHTGYFEVIPEEDAERCIREIDAMINDIQKLGDFGIEKWKV